MTIRKMQCLLTYLGYDTGGVDGIRGAKTEKALRDFQADYGQSPTDAALLQAVVQKPQDFWDSIPDFTRQEFACQCGCGFPAEPKEGMVRIAQAARTHFGRPARVVSGLRCQRHNAAVGGVANSQHMAGEACDLAISGISADALLSFLQAQPGVRYAYKINDTNVHFDIPKGGI